MQQQICHKYLSAFIMSISMVGIMSFTTTSFKYGWHHGFLSEWIKNYIISWPVAFSVIIFIRPKVEKLTYQISEKICK